MPKVINPPKERKTTIRENALDSIIINTILRDNPSLNNKRAAALRFALRLVNPKVVTK